MLIKKLFICVCLFHIFYVANLAQTENYSSTEKPWTYWWWMGSAVSAKGITEQLEALNKAGIGGVHIIPIYGSKTETEKFIPYLSPKWMEIYSHTLKEANRLGMGVDMTLGTGWPFGGPWVKPENTSKKFEIIQYQTVANQPYQKNLVKEKSGYRIELISAINTKNEAMDISSHVNSDGILHWTSDKNYTIVVVYTINVNQSVKRAAPGAEGLVLDPFSSIGMKEYLHHFDSCFKSNASPAPRSFYNDSYEVFNANWTSKFFNEFKKYRGYDLKSYIHYLADTTGSDISKRIWIDYHETNSDMLLENYTKPWVTWCNSKGAKTRNQAHGSPGNLLDLYASADIPETESFGSSKFNIPLLRYDTMYNEKQFERPHLLTMKLASSAANVSGKKLCAAETGTWLADHFQVSLSMIKPQLDLLFLSGINHVVYHGMTYSEFDKPFPGNLFYASTNYGHTSHFWNELPSMNQYTSNCQSILQNSTPDNEILLYFPVYDCWTKSGNSISKLLTIHETTNWFFDTELGKTAALLNATGYSFDYISDRQIKLLSVDNKGNLISAKNQYKTIVVPRCEYMPLATLRQLEILARKGAIVIFMNDIPQLSPGFNDYLMKEKQMKNIADYLKKLKLVYLSTDIEKSLRYSNIYPEPIVKYGLQFIRKKQWNGDPVYFISNLSNKFYSGEVELNSKPNTMILINPTNNKQGRLAFNSDDNGSRFYLELEPGRSCFIKCTNDLVDIFEWKWFKKTSDSIPLNEKWHIRFLENANVSPKNIKLKSLKSWTETGNKKAEIFSGTAKYTHTFDIHHFNPLSNYLLELGDVRETAVIFINGKEIGHLWHIPYSIQIPLGILKASGNILEIDVTNLSINRVIDMDKQGILWKTFNDINFVNVQYQQFDASTYKPAPSGLLGPINLYLLETR